MGGNGKSNEFDVIIVGGGAVPVRRAIAPCAGCVCCWWSVSISLPALRDVITGCCIAARAMR